MDELERTVRAYNEACSHDVLADITAFFTHDAVIYDLNHPPVVGRDAIGVFWGKVRARWGGATWDTDRVVTDGVAAVAEWTMHGRAVDGRPFAFRGADAFAFAPGDRRLLISEIRQYWRFDPERLESGLVGYPYD
jgi:ketosteroid isomerase-like protein